MAKQQNHVERAEAIAADSWGLMQFDQLPSDASAAQQVDALKADAKWMELHMIEVQNAIDELIDDIESEAANG